MAPRRLVYITENACNLGKTDRVVGFFLYDNHKEGIARIDGVLTEEGSSLARYIVVNLGGFLGIQGKTTLIPRGAYEIIDLGEVKTNWSGQFLQDVPAPHDINNVTREEEQRIFSYFDLQPYWTSPPAT